MLHKMIKGYEDYLITDTGQVYSLKRQKYLNASKTKDGYYLVGLYKNKKQNFLYIHRLVALAFIPNPENKPTVDHINQDPTDNRVTNLRWATRKEQIENRNLTNYKDKCRRNTGMSIIEIIGNKEIKYIALRAVPNINHALLSYHINKGETDFYVKQRNGNVRHFIVSKT